MAIANLIVQVGKAAGAAVVTNAVIVVWVGQSNVMMATPTAAMVATRAARLSLVVAEMAI